MAARQHIDERDLLRNLEAGKFLPTELYESVGRCLWIAHRIRADDEHCDGLATLIIGQSHGRAFLD